MPEFRSLILMAEEKQPERSYTVLVAIDRSEYAEKAFECTYAWAYLHVN